MWVIPLWWIPRLPSTVLPAWLPSFFENFRISGYCVIEDIIVFFIFQVFPRCFPSIHSYIPITASQYPTISSRYSWSYLSYLHGWRYIILTLLHIPLLIFHFMHTESYVYIYIYIYIHTCMYTHTCPYVFSYTEHLWIYIYIYIFIYTYTHR